MAQALLGRHVRRCPDGAVDLGEAGQSTRAPEYGDAEIQHLDQPAVDDRHTGRLDVAMDDVDPVNVGEHCGDLGGDRRGPRDVRWGVLVVRLVEDRFEGGAPQQLHDEPEPIRPVGAGLGARVVDGRRAKMLQAGGGADLAEEPLAIALEVVEDLRGLRTAGCHGHRSPLVGVS